MATREDNESWIKDDPNVDPASLRFQPGNLVMYKMGGVGWVVGEVLKICQKLEAPPEFRVPRVLPPILYVVSPHTSVPDEYYRSTWIHHDTDDFIRPRLEDCTPNPKKFIPELVAPNDPLSYMYSGADEDGHEMASVIARLSAVNSATTNPDGSINVRTDGRDITTYAIESPQVVIHGVPEELIIQIAQSLHNRKPMTNMVMADPVDFFKKWAVPKEASLHELEEASTKSSPKMLELGDALMSGAHGWPRDPQRAYECYQAAAYGCQENELDFFQGGIPVGVPEAMVATANGLLKYGRRQMKQFDLWETVPLGTLVEEMLRSERGISMLCNILFLLSSSVRRGYVSPFTLSIAKMLAINAGRLINNRRLLQILSAEEIRDLIQPLLAVHEYRMLEIVFETQQRNGNVAQGDPDANVLEMFKMKCHQIFCDMPVISYKIHIEYRQVPRAPFPMVVYAISSQRKELRKVVRLPEQLQIQAFTQESFEYTWLRIAFELHLGDPVSKERTRSSMFTVLDTPGNRHFAQYLRSQITGSGTEVRLVQHRIVVRETDRNRSRNPQTLGEVVKRIENSLLEIPNFLINERSGGAALNALDSSFEYALEIALREDDGPEEIMAQAQWFKDQGNTLFGSQDFTGAIRSYSLAITLLGRLPEPGDEALLLLGTSLSDRAICYLDMESSRSAAFSKLMVQNAVRDCTVALKSSWSERVLPKRNLDKLKFHLDKGMARLDTLETEFLSEIADPIVPRRRDPAPTRREVSQQVQANPSSEEGTADIQPILEGNDTVRTNATPEVDDDLDDLLLERGLVVYDNTLAKNSNDGCPICLREFDGELSHIFCSLLPCGEHALCVECMCRCKKQSDKEKILPQCPLCRLQFDGRIVQNTVYEIIEKDIALANVVEKFPADHEESIDIAVRLMWRNDFNVNRAIDTIEEILDDRAMGQLFSRDSTDLTPKQKQDIYERARRPVVLLVDQQQRLMEERRTTFNTARLREIEKELRKVRSDLMSARIQARDEIYEHVNSVGIMGVQSSSRGDNSATIQVDFHGMHVGEMHSKYEELVEAILPVVKRVTIITGRGLHSPDRASKLMKALKKRVEKETKTRWSKVPNNPGAIIVTWSADGWER